MSLLITVLSVIGGITLLGLILVGFLFLLDRVVSIKSTKEDLDYEIKKNKNLFNSLNSLMNILNIINWIAFKSNVKEPYFIDFPEIEKEEILGITSSIKKFMEIVLDCNEHTINKRVINTKEFNECMLNINESFLIINYYFRHDDILLPLEDFKKVKYFIEKFIKEIEERNSVK